MINRRYFLIAGATLCGLSVVLGAFGAHGLADQLTPQQLQSFETGVRYQMYHGLAIFTLGAYERMPWGAVKWVLRLWLVGVLFFSFSIYLLATQDLFNMIALNRFIGPVTPLGGILIIAGWIVLLVKLSKNN